MRESQGVSLWKVLTVFVAIAAALWLAVLAGVAWFLTPEPQAPDLVSREPDRPKPILTRVAVLGPYVAAGVVVDGDGQPVEGATLRAGAVGDRRRALASVQTGPDGTFRLELNEAAWVAVSGELTEPRGEAVSGDRADLRFVVQPTCAFRAQVTTPDGDAPEGTWVRGWSPEGAVTLRLAEDGLWTGTGPCVPSTLTAGAPGWLDAEGVVAEPDGAPRLLVLRSGALLEGVVVDGQGATMAGARVSWRDGLLGDLGASTQTGDDGVFSLAVPTEGNLRITARLDGYLDAARSVRLDGSTPPFLELVLERRREVTVWCAGLPDDGCRSAQPIQCTHPLVPWGELCTERDGLTVCPCPLGPVAIRGGGEAARVEAGAEEAWLDFRHEGGVRGRVVKGGEPVSCTVTGVRTPEDLTDLPRGFVAIRTATCDEGGLFRLAGLQPGQWRVDVRAEGQELAVPPVRVQGREVDVGDVELDAGGVIRGRVVTGTTGGPAPNQPVVAVCEARDGMTINAMSGVDGAFVMRGAVDCAWQVLLASRPFNPSVVHVVDGVADGDVTLKTGEARTPERSGFSLRTGDDGALVVGGVAEDGDAADAGLQAGDVVERASVFGVDASELLGLPPDVWTGWVLDQYGGPGVTLTVDREGDAVEVEL